MSEKTAVEFTQTGKRITFSAGYIIGVLPFSMRVQTIEGELQLKGGLLTQLGVVFVDQTSEEIMLRWRRAHAETDAHIFIQSFIPPQKLGNNAEF